MKKERTARPQSARDLGLVLRDLLSEHRAPYGVPRVQFDSLAVLPFFTSASSPDAEYLADGITETLINQFAQLQHLEVIARSMVFRHKQKDMDPIEVGRARFRDAKILGFEHISPPRNA